MSEQEQDNSVSEEKRITFFEKKPRTCPVCGQEFYHETLLTGGGRLIAGPLRNDLRRMYEKSKKYGNVYPLIYVVAVCPNCLYAAFAEDFLYIEEKKKEDILREATYREKYLKEFFGYNVDFTKNRNLLSGAASYFLAICGYYWHVKDDFPTLKKALCCLRLSWILEDLDKEEPEENWTKLIPFFQFKATEYYSLAIEYMQDGKEQNDKVKSYGPDIDNNYGFEGMLYMGALLAMSCSKFIPDPNVRAKTLSQASKKISRVFGSGKTSRSKPSAILEKIKDLHKEIKAQLAEIKEKYGIDLL